MEGTQSLDSATIPDTKPVSENVYAMFNTANADIALVSHEGTIFRVQSEILSSASGWFRTLFSLPQRLPSSTDLEDSPKPDSITMTESTRILETVLNIICWRPIPELDELDFIEDLLRTGEKYEMQGVITISRLAIMGPSLLETHAIRIYGIVSSRGWVSETKQASAKTIGLDLLSPECLKDLLLVNSEHLARLMLLHRRRRDAFRDWLNSTELFDVATDPNSLCSGCNAKTSHTEWLQAKAIWLQTIEQSPSDIVSGAFLQQEETFAALEASCGSCSKKLYGRQWTLQNLREVVDKLPKSVELGVCSN